MLPIFLTAGHLACGLQAPAMILLVMRGTTMLEHFRQPACSQVEVATHPSLLNHTSSNIRARESQQPVRGRHRQPHKAAALKILHFSQHKHGIQKILPGQISPNLTQKLRNCTMNEMRQYLVCSRPWGGPNPSASFPPVLHV